MTDSFDYVHLLAIGTGFGLATGGVLLASLSANLAILLFSLAGVNVTDVFVLVVSTLVTDVALVIIAVSYIIHTDRNLDFVKVRTPTRGDLKLAVIGTGVVLAFLRVVSAVLKYFDIDTATNAVTPIIEQNPEVGFIMAVLAFVSIAPAEELLYRGVIQSRLAEVFRPAVAIAVAAVLFGTAHLVALVGSGTGKIVHIVVLIMLAAIFGVVYERADSIWAPILMHGAYDALLFLAIRVSTS